MATATDVRCRLCLVTPPDYDPNRFAPVLADALAGGDVASLIVTAPRSSPASLQEAAEALVPVASRRGVAALVHNDSRIAGRAKADGIHVDTGIADLASAVEAASGRRIVGAGNLTTRHGALEAGEAEPDYLFFGRLDGDFAATIAPKALDLASWWSSVTVIPAIVMGGNTLRSVDEAAASGIAFIALSSAVWNDPRGASAAVSEASERLASVLETAI